MNIIIRADSALHIGTGHVMRCMVLAKKLRQLGHNISFVMWTFAGNRIEYIEQQGFSVIPLECDPNWHSTSELYSDWLPAHEIEDANLMLSKVIAPDLVIVDHYGLGIKWQQQVKNKIQCKIVAIDDLVRQHDCNLLLDQTLDRQESEYITKVSAHCERLLGSEYALLDERFNQQRLKNQIQKVSIKEYKLLVNMGGIDNSNITLSVLKSLVKSEFIKQGSVSVIISPNSPYYQDVIDFCKVHAETFNIYDFIDDMSSFLAQHQLAIGAAGSSAWERACLGIPSIIIPLADNQKYVCSSLMNHNAVIKIEVSEVAELLNNGIQTLLDNHSKYVITNYKLCDGLGANRVAFQIQNLFQSQLYYRCRYANKDDIQLTYEWQCQAETRKYALNKSIPSYQQHLNWMENKLKSALDYYYIIEIKTDTNLIKPVGVVRLDYIESDRFVISIYIDNKHHGKGLASDTLKFIDIVHPDITIEATVLKDNLASQKLFEKLGYIKINPELYSREPKKVL